MKRYREILRVNPIDTMPNVAVGVSIPFNGTPVFNSTYTTADQIKSNLLNFFLTNKGDRFFNPNFGGDLRAYLFENTPSLDQLQATLSTQIDQYFPMITVIDLSVNIDVDNYKVIIDLTYSVNNTQDGVQIIINP